MSRNKDFEQGLKGTADGVKKAAMDIGQATIGLGIMAGKKAKSLVEKKKKDDDERKEDGTVQTDGQYEVKETVESDAQEEMTEISEPDIKGSDKINVNSILNTVIDGTYSSSVIQRKKELCLSVRRKSPV